MTKNTYPQYGISNACSIIRKDIWNIIKYNENVQSMEDGIWADEVLKKGYRLIYSNKFGVFHSHD